MPECVVGPDDIVIIPNTSGGGGGTTVVNNDYYREMFDCTPAGICVPFLRWYSGVTKTKLYDRTIAGTGYVILGTVSEECCDDAELFKTMCDCLAGVCVEFLRYFKTNCLGVVTVTDKTPEGVIYVPVGVVSQSSWEEVREPFHDRNVNGSCVPVYKVTSGCGVVTYETYDNVAWVPTVSLEQGECVGQDFESQFTPYLAVVASAQYSLKDIIHKVVYVNRDGVNAIVVETVWVNITSGVVIISPVVSHIIPFLTDLDSTYTQLDQNFTYVLSGNGVGQVGIINFIRNSVVVATKTLGYDGNNNVVSIVWS